MIHVVKHSLGVGKKDQKGAKENMMAHADLWGPLASILNDPAITTTLTDLIVGPRGTIWVDCAHDPGLHRLPHTPLCEEDCRSLAVRLIRSTGGRLDDAHPWADATLPLNPTTRMRVHAVLAPLATTGTTISLRALRTSTHTLPSLVTSGFLTSRQCAELVRDLEAHHSILISGATGVGKTTLFGALATSLPAQERLICIEDTAELNLYHPQLVQLVTRDNNTEGRGGIPMSVLVWQALRMRPDRIIVGEVRGNEAVDLLTALNTGHRGSLASIHANSARDVPHRLLTLALTAGMPEAAAQHTIASALDVIVHLARDSYTGQRHISDIWHARNTWHTVGSWCMSDKYGDDYADSSGRNISRSSDASDNNKACENREACENSREEMACDE